MIKSVLAVYCAGLFVLIVSSGLLAQSSVSFSIPSDGTENFISGNVASPLKTGFARIVADPGNTSPDAFAILQIRSNGILVSEFTEPASVPATTHDLFFVEVEGSVNTGVAIANPNPQPATISFGFQDPDIRRRLIFPTASFTIPANSQIARFIDQPPFNRPGPYFGLMALDSSVPVAVTVLRGLVNQCSDFLPTDLLVGKPRLQFFGSVVTQPQVTAGYIPRFADGEGWSTEIVLINTNNVDLSAVRLDFLGPSGEPIPVTINGQTASTFNLGIDFGGITRITTDGMGPGTRAGHIRVTALAHSTPFEAFAILNFKQSGTTVTTTSLPMVQPGSVVRLHVDESGAQLQTGVAIGNTTGETSSVLLELMDAEGRPTGLTSTIQIPPFGEFAKFIREIPGFGGIPSPFRGVLRITASTPESINVVGIRGRINERSDFIMTSVLPFAAENTATETVVPQVVEGVGYSTEVVLFNGRTGTVSSGKLDLVSASASPLTLNTN